MSFAGLPLGTCQLLDMSSAAVVVFVSICIKEQNIRPIFIIYPSPEVDGVYSGSICAVDLKWLCGDFGKSPVVVISFISPLTLELRNSYGL